MDGRLSMLNELGNERILDEGVSKFGLHRIHVMRMGEKVDVEKWIKERVLAVGGTVETFYQYQERELGIWHLRLYWRDGEATK